MVRSTIIRVLFLCYWVVLFTPFITYLAFYANRQYISENLCVEKEIPESCCKGSCYLNEQLEKDIAPIANTEESGTMPNQVIRVFSPHCIFNAWNFNPEVESYQLTFKSISFALNKGVFPAPFVPPDQSV